MSSALPRPLLHATLGDDVDTLPADVADLLEKALQQARLARDVALLKQLAPVRRAADGPALPWPPGGMPVANQLRFKDAVLGLSSVLKVLHASEAMSRHGGADNPLGQQRVMELLRICRELAAIASAQLHR